MPFGISAKKSLLSRPTDSHELCFSLGQMVRYPTVLCSNGISLWIVHNCLLYLRKALLRLKCSLKQTWWRNLIWNFSPYNLLRSLATVTNFKADVLNVSLRHSLWRKANARYVSLLWSPLVVVFFAVSFSWSPIYAMLAVNVLLYSPENHMTPPPPLEKEKENIFHPSPRREIITSPLSWFVFHCLLHSVSRYYSGWVITRIQVSSNNKTGQLAE